MKWGWAVSKKPAYGFEIRGGAYYNLKEEKNVEADFIRDRNQGDDHL